MESALLPSEVEEDTLDIDAWPASLESTRQQLKKAQLRLERYRAALRLAGVEIDQRNRGLIALTTFAYQAGRTPSLAALLKLALVQALETTGAPVGAIILIDAETKLLVLGVHKGLTPELIQILTGQALNYGAAALMPHLVTGAGALLEAATTDDEAERLLLATGRLTSLVSLPLQVGPRLLGAFIVGLRDERCFKPAELCFLMAVSQETAIAVESMRLRENVWQTAEILLGGDTTPETLQTLDQIDVPVNIPTPFELPAVSSSAPQPDQDDLEKLLAAMMDAEDEVQQQTADLQMLNSIAEMMNSTLSLKEILQCAVDETRAILHTEAAWVYLLEENSHLEMEAHAGLSQTYVRGMHRLVLGDGLEGWVAAKNQARFVENVAADGQAYKIWIDKEGLQGLAAVPITRPKVKEPVGQGGAQVVGVLATGKQGQASLWNPREMRLLTSIANQLALAIDNARLYAQVQENELNMRTGNEVLRTLNDMLLEQNVFLEGFVQDDLLPLLARAGRSLERLLADSAGPAPTAAQRQELIMLQEIVNRLARLGQETGQVLDKELKQALDQGDGATGSAGLRPQAQPEGLRPEAQPEGLRPEAQPEGATAQVKTRPLRVEKKAEPASYQQAMSFEEAVAAGLVPAYLLNKELGRPQRES